MDLEKIQSIIDSGQHKPLSLPIEDAIDILRELFEASAKVCKIKDAPFVLFSTDLSEKSTRIWFEWMTEVKGYVVIWITMTRTGHSLIFTRVTKENMTDKDFQCLRWFRFFPKGTTKEMIERLFCNVERVDW